MKLINIENEVNLEMLYEEISMIAGALSVPGHASSDPNYEKRVGASQVSIDEIGNRLWSMVKARKDYPEYHELALRADTREQTKKYKVNFNLTRNDIILLTNAFREASLFTKEFDDFHTMTGHNWSEAVNLQSELDTVVGKIK